MREWLKKIRRYRWVMWTVGAVGAVVRLAWFIFSHYTWLVGIGAMIVAAIGQYYSPKITDAILAGMVAFTAIQILGWQARAQISPKENPSTLGQASLLLSAIKAESEKQPDYQAWDHVDPLNLIDAAALWLGIDPTKVHFGGTPAMQPYLLAMKGAVFNGKLLRAYSEEGASVGDIQYEYDYVPAKIPDGLPIWRAEWKKYAQSRNEKPRFLFPEERK